VTVHDPTPAAVSVLPTIVQFALLDANVTAPKPKPPVVDSAVVPPNTNVDAALEATSAVCGAGLTVIVIPAEVAAT
jgi:hypothetical protein